MVSTQGLKLKEHVGAQEVLVKNLHYFLFGDELAFAA